MAAIAPVLPPGFCFHPTDEQLVDYYLRRKILSLLIQVVIPEIDLCKFDPWELPGMSFLARRGDHQEWYFYSRRYPRYGTKGARINRSSPSGYWKSTGKDRSVLGDQGATIGYKKTLVYIHGRVPDGNRADWAMHEYRLDDTPDAYALYRLYKRNGTTPSPDMPSAAAADEAGASRQVVLSAAAADEAGASRQVVLSAAAADEAGAPMQVVLSAAAADEAGAPMQVVLSAAAADEAGAPMQVVLSAAAADNEQYNSVPVSAANPEEGNSCMQVICDNAWYTRAIAEEDNSWLQFDDDAWYTNIDVDKDDSCFMQFIFNDVWNLSAD